MRYGRTIKSFTFPTKWKIIRKHFSKSSYWVGQPFFRNLSIAVFEELAVTWLLFSYFHSGEQIFSGHWTKWHVISSISSVRFRLGKISPPIIFSVSFSTYILLLGPHSHCRHHHHHELFVTNHFTGFSIS